MERFVRRLMDREDGLAMVSAIIVSFLVVAFGVALVQLSLHNSESSAVDRGRVYAANSVSTSNTVSLNGYQGNDANVYTGGVWSCSNSATVQGSVYAASVNQSGTCTVNGDVTAKNSIVASGLQVGHDLTSSESS